MPTLFDDAAYQDLVVSLLIKDRQFLRQCYHLLSPQDFRPRNGNGKTQGDSYARWVVAQLALQHYDKYKEPIRRLIGAEVIDYCKSSHIEGRAFNSLSDYAKERLRKKVLAPDAVADKLIRFKKELLKANAVQEMIDLQSEGKLDDDTWLDICRKAVQMFSKRSYQSSDYFAEFESRVDRRRFISDDRFPVFFIEPLDALIRSIARGHIGLIMAAYKKGKSLMLIWIGIALLLQRYNVLHITLEDPKDDVEDRYDAAITNLPVKKLNTMRKTARQRFIRFQAMVRGRLRVVDGTDGGVSVPMVQNIWEELRTQGFVADVVIIDYDDEIKPVKKQQERRMEFADIYRDLRQFAAKKGIILWTAAQTKRNTSDKKVVTGDELAEDISKVRKVSLAISIGQGEWGEDSLYLHVAAHKLDKMHVGCNIISDKDRQLIYAREKTLAAIKNPPTPESESEKKFKTKDD